MPETTEPLTESGPVKEVDELLANRIAMLFSTDNERNLIDLLRRLKNEVTRLRGEIADYEQTNLVPRSRYDAVNTDWLEARAHVQTLADKARAEIERLESENAALREQLAQETERAARWETRSAQLGREVEDLEARVPKRYEIGTKHESSAEN